ncbi:hypothetical protein C475_01192 [Halosimplex carlsbadense 2-9-1]|uniref:Uncharacterized protein n=1 Tax=Halosimplex carlsbadense 2-9-1 TaxID=797114 RepID=M0D6I4_9EURY|nr:hypothetical protein C475_01192 [Halosimplex carlsbadense 2-9-1]
MKNPFAQQFTMIGCNDYFSVLAAHDGSNGFLHNFEIFTIRASYNILLDSASYDGLMQGLPFEWNLLTHRTDIGGMWLHVMCQNPFVRIFLRHLQNSLCDAIRVC